MQLAERIIKLSDLLLNIVKISPNCGRLVTGITLDSRKVKQGDLFIACKGAVLDGRNFILDALSKGASAVLCEDCLPEISLPADGSIVVVPDLKRKIGLIAAKFYDYPAKKLTMIGVTGTSGKTSITQHLATVLTHLGIPCGVIGTIGTGFPGRLIPNLNTTPDPVILQHSLFEFVKAKAQAVAMEVSSHSLVQGRVNEIDFSIAVFTNLACEHLDYHGTMEKYGEAKKTLFLQRNLKCAVINADDEFGRNLIRELKDSLEVYAYAISEDISIGVPVIRAYDIKSDATAISSRVTTPWGNVLLQSKLLGRFNVSNLLAVLTVLGIMKADLSDALAEIKKLEAVSGRMQVFGGSGKPLVVVDYSHKPNALEQVLLNLREYCPGALWCVFGCGGDRDRSKRPLMGGIAERLSDHVIITNDNPRTEDPRQIVDDILQGLLCPWAAEIEYDRYTAINYAINNARDNDLILIAGKGHEDYQIIGREKVPFSDKDVVLKALDDKMI